MASAWAMTASAEPPALPRLPATAGQVIVVIAPGWSSTAGSLQRYDKVAGAWEKMAKPIPVSLGKTGLAWGRGLHREVESGPPKQERDGKRQQVSLNSDLLLAMPVERRREFTGLTAS